MVVNISPVRPVFLRRFTQSDGNAKINRIEFTWNAIIPSSDSSLTFVSDARTENRARDSDGYRYRGDVRDQLVRQVRAINNAANRLDRVLVRGSS